MMMKINEATTMVVKVLVTLKRGNCDMNGFYAELFQYWMIS